MLQQFPHSSPGLVHSQQINIHPLLNHDLFKTFVPLQFILEKETSKEVLNKPSQCRQTHFSFFKANCSGSVD